MAKDIRAVVPAFARLPDKANIQEKNELHRELEAYDKRIKTEKLRESPNKYDLFRIIDGKRSVSDLFGRNLITINLAHVS